MTTGNCPMNAQTMLELADDIADIPHEVNLTPRQGRLLQAAANALRESLALRSPAITAQPQCAREARQVADCIRDYLQNKYGAAAVQISSDGIERIYFHSGIPLNDLAAALAGKPGAAHDQLSRLRQAILDNTQGDGFWLGEILLAVLAKETGFNGSVTRPERCRGGE